ncbi:MAG: hypothetical protein K6T34_04615 [Thermoflavifilum sp.]|nr:hypothetical protein [Thermoflavifilum sp.]
MSNINTIPIVSPNDGIVTGKFVPAYTNSWIMTSVFPDGKEERRGIWNDVVSFYKDAKDREILKRVQTVHYASHTSIQEEEVYRNNLQHLSLRIYNIDEEPHTDIIYTDRSIRGKKIFRIAGLEEVQPVSMPFSFDIPYPVFDWHLWGILISGFPLRVGYTARFLAHESYSYLPGDFRWYTLWVRGTEKIWGGKWGSLMCYLVEVKAEVMWKIWIAMDKSVAPVQQICIHETGGLQYWWKPYLDE